VLDKKNKNKIKNVGEIKKNVKNVTKITKKKEKVFFTSVVKTLVSYQRSRFTSSELVIGWATVRFLAE